MNATDSVDSGVLPWGSTPLKTARSCEYISLDQWQEFVASHPGSTPLHHRAWIELMVEQYGYQLYLPAIRHGGEILATTAFAQTRTLTGGQKIVSMPFTDCFAPLGHDGIAVGELIDWFRCEQDPQTPISMRTDQPLRGYEQDQRWLRHRIRLESPMTNLVPLLPSSARRNVRKSIREGLKFERSTSRGAVDEFYRLHVLTRRRLGVPVQARSYFHRLHRRVIQSGLGHVAIVRASDSVIAAAIFVDDSRTMLYKYGASDPSALSYRPNDFLFFNAIQLAAQKHTCFDFGVTHIRDEGLCRFKRKWGGVEEPVYDVCIAGQPETFAGDRTLVKLLSGLIRQSPALVCRAVGQLFYRFAA